MTTDPEKILDANARLLAAFCDNAEQKFKAGDKSQLILAMKYCLEFRRPIPEWARDAFLEAYYILPKSWDDVFGPPIPKGANLAVARRRSKIGCQLYLEVKRSNAEGTPIDDGLFETVGKQFNVSGATAKRMYYDFRCKLRGRSPSRTSLFRGRRRRWRLLRTRTTSSCRSTYPGRGAGQLQE